MTNTVEKYINDDILNIVNQIQRKVNMVDTKHLDIKAFSALCDLFNDTEALIFEYQDISDIRNKINLLMTDLPEEYLVNIKNGIKINQDVEKSKEISPDPRNVYDQEDVILNELTKISSGHEIMKHVSDRLKNDKNFALNAIEKNWHAFNYFSDEIKSDKDVVMVAVEKEPHLLSKIPDKFKNDKDVVYEAIKKNHVVFRFASDEIKQDDGFIMRAIAHEPSKYKTFVQYKLELMNNINFINKVLKENGLFIMYIEENSITIEMVENALNQNEGAFKLIINKFKNNEKKLDEFSDKVKIFKNLYDEYKKLKK